MNDFTKYELQSLLWAIEYVRERTNNCGDVLRATKLKIQSMIDGYCEHDFTINCESNNCECMDIECLNCGRKLKRWNK